MGIEYYNAQLHAVYAELVEQLQIAEIEQLSAHEGAFGSKTVGAKTYWYFRRRVGDRVVERYLGPETPELLKHIETQKAKAADAKQASRTRSQLVQQLRAGGYPTTDPRTGSVLRELARAGVFRLNGMLVGTHAFRCYPALLGARLNMSLAVTLDVDIAQDTSVSLGITDTADPALVEALKTAEEFIEIPPLNRKTRPSSWHTPDRALRVDLLTPLVGKPQARAVELPLLGAHAKPVRFLDFLLVETMHAAVVTGSGILVRVPTPERYALHKLIVAQRREKATPGKVAKDLSQTQALLEVLLEDRPDEVMNVWSDLVDRGRKWKSEAMKSVRRLPKPLQEPFR
jgi:hypothetical protein